MSVEASKTWLTETLSRYNIPMIDAPPGANFRASFDSTSENGIVWKYGLQTMTRGICAFLRKNDSTLPPPETIEWMDGWKLPETQT